MEVVRAGRAKCPSGTFRSFPELPGAIPGFRSFQQGPPGASRGLPGRPGPSRSLPGTFRGHCGLPGLLPGSARGFPRPSRRPAPSRRLPRSGAFPGLPGAWMLSSSAGVRCGAIADSQVDALGWLDDQVTSWAGGTLGWKRCGGTRENTFSSATRTYASRGHVHTHHCRPANAKKTLDRQRHVAVTALSTKATDPAKLATKPAPDSRPLATDSHACRHAPRERAKKSPRLQLRIQVRKSTPPLPPERNVGRHAR